MLRQLILTGVVLAAMAAAAGEREYIWPKDKMPDQQAHQIAALTDEKPDAEKIAPITYDPVAHVYRPLAAPLASAFKVGLE